MMQAIAVKGNSPPTRRQKAVQRTSVISSGAKDLAYEDSVTQSRLVIFDFCKVPLRLRDSG